MNAGTNRGRMDQLLHSVTYFDGNIVQKVYSPALKDFFAYRSSLFLKNAWCVLSAEFVLDRGDVEKKKQLQMYLQNEVFHNPFIPRVQGVFEELPQPIHRKNTGGFRA